MEKRIYIRTDRNGTKYYHDYTCPRCGGAGRCDKWALTGYTCYQCGGEGRLPVPQVIKVYTPEHEEKLHAKRVARLEQREAERKAAGYSSVLRRFGFNDDGFAYVYTGDTRPIKETLKANGARWSWEFYKWISKQPIEDFPCLQVSAAEVFDYFTAVGWALSNPKCEEWLKAHGIER